MTGPAGPRQPASKALAVPDAVSGAGLDPTLAALQAALAAKPGGVVPFDATTLGTAGAALVTLFGDHLGVAAVVLAGTATVTADPDDDTLTVSGPSTTPLLGVTNPAVAATFSTSPDPDHQGTLLLQVDLTVATGTGWTLATSFPMLGTTLLGQVTLAATPPALFRLRSQPGPTDAFGVVEPIGLSLEVSVVVASSPPLASTLTLVPGWAAATIPVSGAVATAKDAESLALRGPSPDTALTLPLVVAGLAKVTLGQLALSVTGTATLDADSAPSTGLAVAVWGTATLSGTVLPLGVTVPFTAGAWTIALLPGHAATLTQVMALLTEVPLLGIVPEAVKNAVSLPVTALSVSLTYDRTRYSAVSVQVQSDKDHPLAWTLVPRVVELTSIGIGLSINTVAGGKRLTSGWVSGSLALDSGVTVAAMVTLPLGSGPITVTANPNLVLADLGALSRVVGGGGLAELLPAGAGTLEDGFALTRVSVTVDPSGELLSDVSVELSTTGQWTVLPGQLVVDGLMIAVDVAHPLTSPQITGQLTGTFTIGAAHVGIAVQRLVAGGDWTLAVQADHVPLPTVADLAALAGTDVAANLPPSLATAAFEIGALELDANLSTPALELFSVSVDTVHPWTLVPDYLVLESVALGLTLDWRSGTLAASGYVIAHVEVADALYLVVSAERQPAGAWILAGALEKPLKVGDLVTRFFPATTVPEQVAGLAITKLSFTADTADGTYTFEGALTWPFTLGDVAFQIDAAARVHRAPDPATKGAYVYSGQLSGSLKSHFGSDQLSLSVGYKFAGGDAPVYIFVLGFNALALTCTLTKNKAGDSILTAALTGVSFGDVVEFLVNLVDPSLHFTLSSPWDVLNQIRFDDFSLVANVTQRTVGLKYTVGKDLGIVDIETISLTYVHKGGQGTVEVAITGRFLDQTYTDDKPLTWDLLNESPPTTPGAGSKLLDLKYLGVGQHVVLVDPQATTMPLVLADLKQTVLAAADSTVQPWDLLTFDASSGWLVGAQFVVMDTVSLGLVFNDPVLYGVQISLAGDKAGIFAGLDFQILYRKVTDSVGVYHIELKLPDVMRHLEFGEVSITLPIVILDIYTNGDFAIDFGFPFDNDWSVCFGVEVFPFVGAGGFYFAKLSSATATGLPQITNGTFNPVIEFGVALAIGVGKEFDAGPLSAGLSVAVQGVLQGTVAPFNPAGPGPTGDRYYWIKGSIAIVGKLYGIVDFKIITIDISIVAYASATLIIEAYQPILIELSVGVTVTASIKILFIRIHFSFKMQLDASFTIGSASTPPWTLAAGPGGAGGPAGARASALAGRRRRYPALAPVVAPHPRAAARRRTATAPSPLTWSPVAVLANAPVPIPVRMVPVLTVAGGPALSVEAVLVPFAQTTASTAPATAAELVETVVAEGTDPADIAFNRLVEAMLRWGVHSLLGRSTGPVSAVDLQTIYADLGTAATADTAFDYPNLSAFLAANLVLAVAGPGDGTAPDMSGAALPIMPPLQMTAGSAQPVQFWALNQVGAAYEEQVAKIVASLAVPYGDQTATDPTAPPAAVTAPALGDAGTASLPTVVFDDYLLLLTKAAVQAGLDTLRTLTHTALPGDSLATLAAAYCPPVGYAVRAGDTAASVAAAFGIDAADLVAANPGVDFGQPLVAGQSLIVPPPTTTVRYVLLPADVAAGDVLAHLAARFAVSAASVQAANPGVDFATVPAGTAVAVPVPAAVLGIADANLTVPVVAGVPLTLGGVTYRTQAGDTLQSIAVTRFGQPDPVGLAAANAGDPDLLATGASLTVASAGGPSPGTTFGYVVATGDTVSLVSAVVWVRNAGAGGLEYAGWFGNAIAAANPTVDFTSIGVTPTALTVPSVTVTDHGLQPSGTPTQYMTKPGDTLDLVAGYAAAIQTEPDLLSALEQQISTLNPTITPGSTIQIPAQAHQVVDGESLASIAARFGVAVADLATVNATATMLAAGASVTLPPSVEHVTLSTDTLPSLASAYGLTLDHLIGQTAVVAGLLGPTVTIPNARQADLDELVTTLEANGSTNHAAGMVSRFLLNGLQLPDPAGGTDTPPLFTLTGQQLTVATPPVGPPTTEVDVTFTAPAPVPWLALVVPYLTKAGDTLASVLAEFGLTDPTRLEQLNPGVDFADLPAGITLDVPRPSLDVDLTVAMQTAQWPDVTFDPELTAGPQRLPLLQTAPVKFAMSQPIAWQAAVPPELPTTGTPPVASQPSLWPLPPDLLARVAAEPQPHPYDLVTGVPTASGVAPTPVATYAWGTSLPVVVRRVAAGAAYLPNTYALLGVPQTGRDTLLGLWTSLASSGDGAALALLAPSPASSGSGLRSDAVDPALTAVLRTNLSTDTHSGVGAADVADEPAPAGIAYAALAAPEAFLQQLWECSVTGSGGYFLTYATTGGAGLPDAAFAAGDDVTLQLVVLLAAQTAAAPDRTLHPFTNVAVVLDAIDASRVSVYAEASDGSNYTRTSTVPPGSVGFEVARRNASLEPPDPGQRTRSLAGLLGWSLATGGGFTGVAGLPVGPVEADPAQRISHVDHPAFVAVGANTDPSVWHFQQVVPVARFAAPLSPTLPAGLPPAASNPYAGLGGTAAFALGFRDVFGNDVAAAQPLADVSVPIGYTDEIQGLSAWPGATADYTFSTVDGVAELTVEVSLGIDRYLPSAAQTYPTAARAAAAALVRYGLVGYQLHQPDVSATVTTSLDQPGTAAGSGTVVLQPLRGFADAAYLFLAVAQALQPVEAEAAAGSTLADLASAYGAPLSAFGTANAGADAVEVFAGPLTVWLEHVVVAGDTFDAIAAATGAPMLQVLGFAQNADLPLTAGTVLTTGIRTVTVAAGDTLASLALLAGTTVDTLATANAGTVGLLATGATVTVGTESLAVQAADTFATLVQRFAAQGVTTTVDGLAEANAGTAGLLVTGAVLAIAPVTVPQPPSTVGVRTYVVAPGDTLASIAAAQACTVAGLATANGQAGGLLVPGPAITVRGTTFDVQAGDTFATLAARWVAQDLPVGVADVAVAAQATPGLLAPGATVSIVEYVVAAGQTVADVLAAVPTLTAAQLVSFAGSLPNVFPAGTGLYYGTTTYQPIPGETLAAAAAASGDTVEQLAAANAATTLVPGAVLEIPGAVRLGSAAGGQLAGYSAPVGATLASVAAAVGVDAGTLADANATMPGLFVPGVQLDTSPPVVTGATSTFATLAAAAGGMTVAAFGAAVEGVSGLIAPAALFVTGLPPVGARTFAQLAADLGVPIDALATANAPLLGLVQPGAGFAVGAASVTATGLDTLASLAYRFTAQGVVVDVVGLVGANATTPGLLAPTSVVIVPPAPAVISLPIVNPRVPAPIFALDVALSLARDPGLVDPEFAGVAAVRTATTPVAASTAGSSGAAPSLIPLATAFGQAFAAQRLVLATGPVPSTGKRQVWVVDFGADGFARFATDGAAARFFALAPMSTEPLSASGVPIAAYDPATGQLGAPTDKSFRSVDVDAWLATLLAAVDEFLSPASATAAYSLGGHQPLEDVVAAKQEIALALRPHVKEILAGPDAGRGAVDGLAQTDATGTAAQDALYQSMLVTLATAYSTDAVVVVPVEVASPYGQPCTAGPTSTFATLAAYYQVSQPGVALGLADAAGLLVVGSTLVYAGMTHQVQATDTLDLLATLFSEPVTALPAGLSVQGGGPMFATATIPRVAVGRTPDAGDSFATVATYLGVDVGTCAVANADVDGLLVVGTVLTVGGHSHTVAAGESLTDVATALGSTPTAVATDASVVDRGGILSPSVTLHAISGTDPIAPRLSGTAAARLYALPAGAVFADLVGHYGVSPDYLAGFLADEAGLVASGISVGFGTASPVVVAAGDTPAALAAALGTTVVDLLSAPVLLPGVALFTAGFVVPLTGMVHVPTAADSFSTLAARFQTTVGDVAEANAAVAGLLIAGSVVTVRGTSHTVLATDTLLTIADAFGLTPARLCVQPTVVATTGWFDPSTPVHELQPTPASSFSTAKTALTGGGSRATFLFSTAADATYRNLVVDLDYPLDEIEFEVRDVPMADGYQSSQWLRPVLPLASGDFSGAIATHVGQVVIPLPLRGAPSLPVVQAQLADPAAPEATTIGEAKQWQLDVTFTHQSAAQDDVYLQVGQGGAGGPGLALGGVSPAVFAALAQFAAVWPAMQADVARLQQVPLGSGDPRSDQVAATFAGLVTALAGAMTAAAEDDEVLDAGPTLTFRLETTYDYATDPVTLASVTLVALPASDAVLVRAGTRAMSPAEPVSIPWPDVYLPASGGSPRRRLVPDPPSGDTRTYAFPPGVPAFTDLALQVVLPGTQGEDPPTGFDAVAVQQATASVMVTRNEGLVVTAPTAADFVYRTPWMGPQSPAIPSLTCTSTIDVGTAGDLGAAVTSMLTQLLTLAGTAAPAATVTLGCRYAQPLAPASTSPVVAYLPVLYLPHTHVGGSSPITVPGLAQQVAAQVAAWAAQANPRALPGDAYVFDLALFGAADLSVSRPLVTFTGLTAPFDG